MNYMRSFVSTGGGTAAGTALAPAAEERRPVSPARVSAPQTNEAPKTGSGYGLPCAKCRKYYAANLSACPVCKSAERVSPIGLSPSRPPAAPAVPVSNAVKGVDEERPQHFAPMPTCAESTIPPVSARVVMPACRSASTCLKLRC